MKRPDRNTPLNFTEKYRSRISLIVSVITMLILCLFLGQIDKIMIQSPLKEKEEQQKKEEEQKELAEAEPDIYTASFLAVGDSRFSEDLIYSGYNEESGTYNFDNIYSQLKSTISAADFALLNQETIFTKDRDSISGEDTFATPTEAGDALVSAGFDGAALASNHTDDFGASMIAETLDFWSSTYPNFKVLGVHASETDAGEITIVEINKIKVALLDYTSSSYTASLEEENAYMIDQLDKTKLTSDIAKAKAASDCVIVIANWGEEENPEVDDEQKEIANFLLSQGVAVTIGMNPREIQPYETLTDASGNSMLVYYSLGNFVSTQGQVPRLLGGMAQFTIEKTIPKDTAQPATVRISTSSLEPTVMHYNHDENLYQVYMLSSYTDELAASHSIHDMTEDEFTLDSLKNLFRERTGKTILAGAAVDSTETTDAADSDADRDTDGTDTEDTDNDADDTDTEDTDSDADDMDTDSVDEE